MAVDRWRVAVVGVFELVARHLAFHDARIGAAAACGEQFVEDLGGDDAVGVVECRQGEKPGWLEVVRRAARSERRNDSLSGSCP